MFGLIVCFITFGLYTFIEPYDQPHVNLLAQACQCQIFFALLSSIALKFAAAQTSEAGESILDMALVVLTFLPMAFVTVFQVCTTRPLMPCTAPPTSRLTHQWHLTIRRRRRVTSSTTTSAPSY